MWGEAALTWIFSWTGGGVGGGPICKEHLLWPPSLPVAAGLSQPPHLSNLCPFHCLLWEPVSSPSPAVTMNAGVTLVLLELLSAFPGLFLMSLL